MMNPYAARYFTEIHGNARRTRPPTRPVAAEVVVEPRHTRLFAKLAHLRRHKNRVIVEVAAGMSSTTTTRGVA